MNWFQKLWMFLCAVVAAFLIVAVFAGLGWAQTVTAVGVHVGSQHFPKQDFNNFNPGVYVQFEAAETAWVAGAYYNSERRPTVYAGWNYSVTPWLDVTLGGATGYRWPVTPAIIPSVHFPVTDNVHARVAFIPRFEKSGSNVVHLAMEWRY